MPRCSTACSTGSECSRSLCVFFLEASKKRLRSTQFWAAVDWLTQFGDDPDREIYPESWNGALVPAPFWGSYNTPGWTANGTNPYPTKAERAAKPFCESSDEWVQPDPIAAEAMLFFKGWLLLNMGVYARVSGDTAKWEREWTMSGRMTPLAADAADL